MEFTTLKTQSINLGIFDNIAKGEDSKEIIKSKTVAYSEESLADLKEHCMGILEKGEDASAEEISSVTSALNEVQSLVKGEAEEDGIIVPFYYKE